MSSLRQTFLPRQKKQSFSQICQLIEQKNYFKVKTLYQSVKYELQPEQEIFIEATLDNAFNKPLESNRKIAKLSGLKTTVSDSLMIQLYKVKADNFVKTYDYKQAKNVFSMLLDNYAGLLDQEEKNDFKNSLKLWTALEEQPRQRVAIHKSTRLKFKKDKAGLNNLSVAFENDTADFIFDTGANLSTISKSTASRFKMKIIPANIQVDALTGAKVDAQLAVCEKMNLGNITIENAVFLVFDDPQLAFPQINYQINGILGFPVLEALGEIQITRDGFFVVPLTKTIHPSESNMAMDELTPLINIEGRHFTFDTGADHTILYSRFYAENKKEIDSRYKPITISLGGAGGKESFEGYKLDHTFNVLGKTVKLGNISLLKENIKDKQTVYGNIGQDLIKSFSKMIINFKQMLITFE